MKVHDVSILDLDKEGSLNLDADSDEGNRTKVALEGDLGEGGGTGKNAYSAR